MPILGTRGSLSARGFGLFGKLKAITDPYFKYVTMLLHGDGTNGAQNNTFLDSSSNNFTITRNGNTTQGSFSPYGSNWGNYFGATGQYLSVPYASAFNLTGDFTIECWINPGNLPSTTGAGAQSYERIFSFGTYNAANSLGLEINSNDSGNVRKLISWYNGSSNSVSANNAVSPGVWYHIAMVRSGTTITTYINGTSTGLTITGASAAVNTSQAFYIASLQGFEGDASAAFNGYISNFRLVKGTALYTSNFTPSTTPLTAVSGTSLLTCQSNRFIDNSSNNFTITKNGSPSVQRFSPFAPTAAYSTATIGGSGYFDGSGDNLSISGPATGTGTWTLEGWFYFNTLVNEKGLFSQGTSDNTGGFIVWSDADGTIRFYSNSNIAISSAGAVKTGCWQHVAVVSNSSNIVIYVNGVSVATGSYSGKSFNNSPFQINKGYGGVADGNNCYITDARMVVGTAVYTSAFTPPTAPLTAITNTSLLLNFTNGAIYDNAMMNDLETVGNAQISTSVKKYGTGSLAFDGSGDYMKQLKTTNVTLGTGAFTFEFWFRTSASTQYMSFFSNESGGGGFTILINSSAGNGVIQIYNGGSGLIHASSAGGWNDGNWHFLVLDRDSSGSRLFIDGTQQGSTNSGQASAVFDAGDLIIGNNLAYGGRDYNGYIDDLRITKGYARYTANFTPPTAAFPNQ